MTGIVPPGQGRLLTARGNVMAFKAVADQTSGDFSLMERTVPAGARTPPPHRHVTCSEAFFVLDGTVTFWLDDAELTGGAGDFLLVPRGASMRSVTMVTGRPGCWCCTPRPWMLISRNCTSSGLLISRRRGRSSWS
jgi:mannose-6-phosphate isomerase-like protein (cupin superfamily)